jgi:hypothetical protein
MRNTVRKICESDETGAFHLDVQAGPPRRRLRVEVVWEEEETPEQAEAPDDLGWPPGFFERFPGIFADDPIELRDQGVAEERPLLEPS